jgi:hypothetical protein
MFIVADINADAWRAAAHESRTDASRSDETNETPGRLR